MFSNSITFLFLLSSRPTSLFTSVVWPKGRIPSDKPECGFNNEFCEWLNNGELTQLTFQKRFLSEPRRSTHKLTSLIILRHRHRPARPAGDLPRHRGDWSSVHRVPQSAEDPAPDEAGRLLLVAHRLQRHHRHQGAPCTGVNSRAVIGFRSKKEKMPVSVIVFMLGVCLCLLQGNQALSLTNSGSQSGSAGTKSIFSNNSYGLMDKAGRENIFTTIGLYQVVVFSEFKE